MRADPATCANMFNPQTGVWAIGVPPEDVARHEELGYRIETFMGHRLGGPQPTIEAFGLVDNPEGLHRLSATASRAAGAVENR